jgi:hypothetical protein
MGDINAIMRKASDGTFEILVPEPNSGGHYILPYAFHTKAAGRDWIRSRKGKAILQQLRLYGPEFVGWDFLDSE